MLYLSTIIVIPVFVELRLTRKIYNSAFLIYLRGFFRRNYDRRILPDDELENITADNCDEYKAILDQRQQEFAA